MPSPAPGRLKRTEEKGVKERPVATRTDGAKAPVRNIAIESLGEAAMTGNCIMIYGRSGTAIRPGGNRRRARLVRHGVV
jgi:hypothetical protein